MPTVNTIKTKSLLQAIGIAGCWQGSIGTTQQKTIKDLASDFFNPVQRRQLNAQWVQEVTDNALPAWARAKLAMLF